MSRIHVLMCCHNGEAFVAEQLRSILAQDRPVDVIHTHDFGSTDSTVARIQELASGSGVPIELTRHPDAPGASLSFFRALALLSETLGERDIVLLADQDDVWLSHKTAVQLALLEAPGLDPARECAVFHDVQVVDSRLQLLRPTYYTGNPFALPRDLHPERLLLANPVIGHTLAVSAALIRRVVRMARPASYLMHDWTLVLYASRFGEIRFVPQALSLYRQHAANVLGAYGRRRLRDVLRRVTGFSDAVVQQALAFNADLAPASSAGTRLSHHDRWLARHSPAAAYALLAASALVHGPTVQRKGLGLFIAAHGLRRTLGRSGSRGAR